MERIGAAGVVERRGRGSDHGGDPAVLMGVVGRRQRASGRSICFAGYERASAEKAAMDEK